MFSPEDRERIRLEILDAARSDERISSAAITGSASVGRMDRWSDIDLAFGVRKPEEIQATLGDFSARMYRSYGALHHLDVPSAGWLYRVFFLASTLQVDLAFVAQADFGSRAPTFQLAFGSANAVRQDPVTPWEVLSGWAWLYALHARTCIRRGEHWRAELMITGMRSQVISLCCLRHGLPERQGRGVDRLPEAEKARLLDGLVRSVEKEELGRAFQSVTEAFLAELLRADEELASRLRPALESLLRA